MPENSNCATSSTEIFIPRICIISETIKGMRVFELHSNEWSIVEALIEVLRMFKRATVIGIGYNYVSASKFVLIIKRLQLFFSDSGY